MAAKNLSETLTQLSLAISDFKAAVAVRHLTNMLRKYRPDQPRVAAGVPEGGQWTSEGSSPARVAMARRFRLTPQLEQECEDQLAKDTFHCNMVGLAECHAQASVRYGACRTGRYIPPLNYGGTL